MSTLYTEDQLHNLILQCPDENSYPDPETMIDENGKRLYAYVTLIMLGTRYIAGAIVLAHTLRLLNSQADLVVLVTPDVGEDGKRVLSTFFDKVIEIDYVNVANWRTKKQTHRKYLELVFTKFHLFKLTEYKKILLIDADALVLKYPDHLFTLEAPAGCFLEDKDLFITYDKQGNYVLPEDGKIKWYQKYCDCCSHGKLIPKNLTDRVATDSRNSGIGGGLILLEPKKGEFESILKDVSHGKMKYLVENKFVWPEQQYLTLRYSGQWHSINPRFFGLQGYPHWSVLYGLQYGGDKPFMLDSKFDMSIRTQYPDYILFHQYYEEILQKYPLFKTNPVLQECNDMHKYFKVHLNRVVNHDNLNPGETFDVNLISRLFKLQKPLDNSNELLEYYFTDRHLCYRPFDIDPMFKSDNIKPFDFFRPIELLQENFRSKYYEELLPKKINITERLDKIMLETNIDLEDLDNIMLNYIRCRPKTFMITLWPLASKEDIVNNLVNELNGSGNVYYVRNIQISFKGIKNLMFWMYDEFSFNDRLTFIDKKLEYSQVKKYDKNQITIIIYDNVKDQKLSGQASNYKKFLRNLIGDLFKNNSDIRGNDLMHINDHFYQTITYAELLLNQNSLNVLENQDISLSNVMADVDLAGHLKLQTFKKYLYSNLSQLEMSKLITMGGATLYAYGIRSPTDIDSIMIKPNSPELEQLMYDVFQNKSTKFEFIDMGIEGKFWRDSWTQKNNEIFNFFDVDIDGVVTNPRYHFYFQGLKFYLLDYEIVRKLFRSKVQDFADFVIILFTKPEIINDYVSISDDNKLITKLPEFKMELRSDQKCSHKTQYINLVLNMIRKKYDYKKSKMINFKFLEKLLCGYNHKIK
jgi:hypothetical protein